MNPVHHWFENEIEPGSKVHLENYDMIVDPIDTNITPPLKSEGVWERNTTTYLKTILRKGQIFVDCGAHWGYYTCLASKLVGQSGHVYSFEPNLISVQLLSLNISLNELSNVSVIPLALWNLPTMLEFVIETQTTGGSHVIGVFDRYSRGQAVIATTLDKIFEPNEIDVLKVDCEGSDVRILKGAENILSNGHAIVISENPNVGELERYGYKIIKKFTEEQVQIFTKATSELPNNAIIST